ncbi:MAG: hypothetical protein FIA99_05420 [Ruminiclostridium sp.]|nr:hypothetical protein [Ruminiclostridium sp.]
MSNIYKRVCDALEPLGYPVREQGSYAKDEDQPETHITYQLIDAPNNSHADNSPTSTTPRMQLALYSRRPATKQDADRLFKSVMLPAGFMRAGGRDLPFNPETGHYGYTSDYKYFETEV